MALSVDAQVDAVKLRVATEVQRRLAETAKAANAKIMATPPRPLSMVRHVDGVAGAPEEAVKPGGVIVYDYGRLDLVASFALDTLRQLSPIESGNYARSHTLLLNGQQVDDVRGWKEGDEIAITNHEPYTRKIEIGKGRYSAHAHVYEKAERIVSRRFGNIARVWFVYRPVPFGNVATWAGTTKLRRAGSPKLRAVWLTRQPTLVIREIR